jgi:protein-L-isoaspartate(D-aspartate) O-methyltransferase
MRGTQSAPFSLEQDARLRAEAKAQLLLSLRAKGLRDVDVLRALEMIPREIFVAYKYIDMALRDVAVPIGCGQTLFEPSLLAQMLGALKIGRGHRILEIGTGSGYGAAVLSRLGREVLSLECFQTLALEARTRLERLEIANVQVVWADGFEASPSNGLFDRILIDASVDEIPPNLFSALGQGGILVAARKTSDSGGCATLTQYIRNENGDLAEVRLGPCRSQPLLHGVFSAI